MFLETRKVGKNKKYYLVHSYRIGKKIKRISRFLGSNLNKQKLEKLRKRAEQLILEEIKERNILEFELTVDEIEAYKKYEKEIKISHLQKLNWKNFTELFTYHTNAIEGSTVELSEVKDLLEHKDKPENLDELESINVAQAVKFTNKTTEKLSIKLINQIHLICFKGTKSFAGKLRTVEVVIRDAAGNIVHQGAPAREIRQLLEELCNWYQKHQNKYPPLLLAALVHNQFENIHPYQDGNGRVGRLLLNYVLLKHNYPPINISLKDGAKYYQILQTFQKKGDIKPTLRFLISEYRKQYS